MRLLLPFVLPLTIVANQGAAQETVRDRRSRPSGWFGGVEDSVVTLRTLTPLTSLRLPHFVWSRASILPVALTYAEGYDGQRCTQSEPFKKIDAAFRSGDLLGLRAALAEPDNLPNGAMPFAIGSCLEYAIYHSPLAFIRTLLELGADHRPVLLAAPMSWTFSRS